MFGATGFAGIASASTKAGDGIEGKSLKAVYDFWSTAEGGWQKGNAYLDSGKTGVTSTETIYRYQMKIKPFGNWEKMSVGFQSPSDIKEFVYRHGDGGKERERDARQGGMRLSGRRIRPHRIPVRHGRMAVQLFLYALFRSRGS